MTYKKIPTFSGDAYKSYIRESVLNPMIDQHNKMGVDIIESKAAIDTSKEGIAHLNSTISNTTSHVADLGIRVHELERSSTSRVTRFTDLEDAPRHLECNKFLKVSNDGTHIEFADGPVSSGGGSGTFTSLSDTPDSFSGEGGKVVKVNALGNALIFSEETVGATSFTDLNDTPSSIPPNKMLRSNATGELVFDEIPSGDGSGGSRTEYFTELLDTPSVITPGKMLVGNAEGNGLEFVEIPSGGGSSGGSVDLGPLTDRVAAVEDDVSSQDARITTLENSGAGGSIPDRLSAFWHNPTTGGPNFDANTVHGRSIVHASSGSTSTINLPGIGAESGQVPTGKHLIVSAEGGSADIVPSDDSQILFQGTYHATLSLTKGQAVTLVSFTHKGAKRWIVVNDTGFGGSADTSELETTVADHEARISDLEAGSGGGSSSGPVDVADLTMTFKSEASGTYTAADVMSTSFLNVRAAGTTITMPTVKIGGNGTTEAKGGEIRYICAYENSVTLAGGAGGANAGGKQNVSWGGSGEATKVVPKGTTVGLVAVAIDSGSWSNWQVFSEVASRV